MKHFFSTIIFICAFLLSCNNDTKHFDKQSYDQNKESLATKEKNNPVNFLKISADDHKNLLTFGKTIVKGTITNTATVCSYKDVRVKMLSYDKTGKMVEEHEDVISDVVKPAASIDFKTKYHLPKGTDSIALSVMSATSVLDTLKK